MKGGTKPAPSSAPDVIREVERRVGVADPESPLRKETAHADTGRRREVNASAFGSASSPPQKDAYSSKRDLPSIRTQNGGGVGGAARNDLTLSYARAATGPEHKAAGRQRGAAGAGSSPIKRIKRVEMRSGFHWTATTSVPHMVQANAYQSRLPQGPAVRSPPEFFSCD